VKVSALQRDGIGLLALDEAYLVAESLGLTLDEPTNAENLNALLARFISLYSEYTTGIVLDPTYSLPLLEHKHKNSGLALRIEQERDQDPLSVPRFIPQWGIEDVRNNYGVAKLELYYHPAEEMAAEKKKLVADLFDFCQYEGIDFLLKLVIYHPPGKEMDMVEFQETQLEAIAELQRFSSLLALQYPQDPLATATLTSSLDIPWIVISDGMNYEKFKDSVRVSTENGAKGFLAGRTLWEEIGEMRLEDQSPDFDQIESFLKTTGKDRVIELMRIIKESQEE
jgi:tagatose-1,6-bisphosphate aldolase